MKFKMLFNRSAPFLFLLSVQSGAYAQLAVSSNDNKARLINGVNNVVLNPTPDTATIIDLGANPPRVIAEVEAPGGWSAPPQSVAVAPDESIALVVSSTAIDPENPRRTVFNDEVTVIDLQTTPPRVIDTVRAGSRASGISINPAGTLALVANRAAGTVTVFSINGKELFAIDDIQICESCQPSLPVFTPDGSRALVSRNADHKVSVLEVNGQNVRYSGTDISANMGPYSLDITPDSQYAVVANIGNGPTGGVDTVSIIDLHLEPPRLVNAVTVGIIPEGLALSPEGAYLAVPVMNGSNLPPETPWFHDNGWLKIYRLSGMELSLIDEIETGHWCQGVVWSDDSRRIAVQCAADFQLELFDFDGETLTAAGVIEVNGSPTGIRTAQGAR